MMAKLQACFGLLIACLSIASAYPAAEVPTHEIPAAEILIAEAIAAEANNGTLVKRYNDGEGTYIGSDSEYRYASGVKCWTDYFVVAQSTSYGNWYPASDKVYCTGTSTCTVAKMTGTQNCETWSINVSVGIETKIVKFGIDLGYALQKCQSASDTTSCTWSDGQCHIIWAQQQYLTQGAYQRRRCHDQGRDYTAWIRNFEHKAPTSSMNYGCGSKCTDSK